MVRLLSDNQYYHYNTSYNRRYRVLSRLIGNRIGERGEKSSQ
jgi:hypothetical protein